MYLSGELILQLIKDNELVVEPFVEECLKPASYVLHLGNRYRRWKKAARPIDMFGEAVTENFFEPSIDSDAFIIEPDEFVLGETIEKISLPHNVAGIISPLSHISRFGLTIHGGADWVNPGFGETAPTTLTLELKNNNSSCLLLRKAMPVAHLRIVNLLHDGTHRQYRPSIYEGQDSVAPPLLHEEWCGHRYNINDK